MSLRHSLFGEILVTVNPRARRYVFRFDDQGVMKVTVPCRFTEESLLQSIDSMQDSLMKLRARSLSRHAYIDSSFCIEQDDFRMHLREGNVPRVQARMSEGTLDVVYPNGTDFQDSELQQWLLHVAEEALRHHAKIILPPRLKCLADKCGLQYGSVKIRNSHGRWGSCSTQKNINLSMYLILLPRHLQDYVMLHELTHIIHMNHSEGFWKQLDQFCGCSSKELRKEISAYTTSIFFRRK